MSNPILVRTNSYGERVAAALYLAYLINVKPSNLLLEKKQWMEEYNIVALDMDNKQFNAYTSEYPPKNKLIIDFASLLTYNNITDLNAFFNPPPPKPVLELGKEIIMGVGESVFRVIIVGGKYGLIYGNCVQDAPTAETLKELTEKINDEYGGYRLGYRLVK